MPRAIATILPRLSLTMLLAAIPSPAIRRHGRTVTRDAWQCFTTQRVPLPLWEATDRVAHRRLVFAFRSRVAYVRTLRALADIWTTPIDDTITLY